MHAFNNPKMVTSNLLMNLILEVACTLEAIKDLFYAVTASKSVKCHDKWQGSVNVPCKKGLMWIATGIHFEFCRDGLGITTGSLHRQREDNSRAHQINRCQQNHSQIIRKQALNRCKQSLWHWLEFAKVPRWTFVSIEWVFLDHFDTKYVPSY